MKITCTSCGAKYTIADEKIGGRRVKVRCKNCKASILVDGAGGGEGGDVGGEVSDLETSDAAEAAKKPPERKPVKKNAWSVNLSDDDSREMTTDELVQGWKDGVVTQDAYVWKDGLEDWKPILEVPELKLRLKAIPAKSKDDDVVTSSKRGAAKAGTDDLFGGADFGAKPAAAAPGLAPKDKPPAQAATGARNESSVLFSLDALKTHDTKDEKTDAADIFGPGLGGGGGVLGGLGGGMGGGLGGNLDLLTAPAKDPPPAPVGARAPALATPIAQESSKSSKLGLIIGGGVVVVGLIVGGVLMMGEKKEDAETAAALSQADAEKAALDAKLKEAEAKVKEAEQKVAAEKAAAEKAAAEAKAAAEKAAAEAKAEEKPAETKPAEAKPAEAKPTESKPATSTASTSTPAAAAPSGGGAFDTAAAKSALSAAAANSAACAQPGGPTGAGKVEVTFAPSGRVTSANVVSGPFGGTAVGGCIASTFRRAKVPAFSGSPVTVAKSFTIN